jgi:hypothetical protein
VGNEALSSEGWDEAGIGITRAFRQRQAWVNEANVRPLMIVFTDVVGADLCINLTKNAERF